MLQKSDIDFAPATVPRTPTELNSRIIRPQNRPKTALWRDDSYDPTEVRESY